MQQAAEEAAAQREAAQAREREAAQAAREELSAALAETDALREQLESVSLVAAEEKRTASQLAAAPTARATSARRCFVINMVACVERSGTCRSGG